MEKIRIFDCPPSDVLFHSGNGPPELSITKRNTTAEAATLRLFCSKAAGTPSYFSTRAQVAARDGETDARAVLVTRRREPLTTARFSSGCVYRRDRGRCGLV
ncbi:hypothetical protein EVAR_49909_1 [Eumeta japonica]|uniref:Uncharacterized protein n=1 Tax=Eumeta variegata TaxID=151549 RepID=A0A4C1Y546_EUMVA|nr:hypothetical protein EVAR_49909_1 [Eumeta japonica]